MKKRAKLTRSKLMKGEEGPWEEWQQSEFKQWDQYEVQHMFGQPDNSQKEQTFLI